MTSALKGELLGSLTLSSQSVSHGSFVVCANDGSETLRVESDGRIYWNGRLVEGDDAFKAAMIDLRETLHEIMSVYG